LSKKCGSLDVSENYVPPRLATGIALPFFMTQRTENTENLWNLSIMKLYGYLVFYTMRRNLSVGDKEEYTYSATAKYAY
jgi:hypothetical protein